MRILSISFDERTWTWLERAAAETGRPMADLVEAATSEAILEWAKQTRQPELFPNPPQKGLPLDQR